MTQQHNTTMMTEATMIECLRVVTLGLPVQFPSLSHMHSLRDPCYLHLAMLAAMRILDRQQVHMSIEQSHGPLHRQVVVPVLSAYASLLSLSCLALQV